MKNNFRGSAGVESAFTERIQSGSEKQRMQLNLRTLTTGISRQIRTKLRDRADRSLGSHVVK